MSKFTLFTDLTADHCPNLNFLSERCVRRRLTRSECAECLNICPSEAFSLINNQVDHDLNKCTGCMMCAALCPNDAFEVEGNNLEARIKSLSPEGDVYVSCSREKQIHPDECVVPCVGALSLVHLLALCLKPSAKIIFNVSACESCENKAAADQLKRLVRFLNENLHDSIDAELIIHTTAPEILPTPAAENRRFFLKGMTSSLVSAVESQLPAFQHQPSDGGSRNRRVPGKVRLVRDLLKQLDQKKKDLVSALCLHTFKVSDKCSVCPLCKGICPTGAIQIDRADRDKTLAIDNTLCSGCGLCVTFCKNEALQLRKPMSLNLKKEGGNCCVET